MKKIILALVGCFVLFSCSDPESNSHGAADPVDPVTPVDPTEPVQPVEPVQPEEPKTEEQMIIEFQKEIYEVTHNDTLDMVEGLEALKVIFNKISELDSFDKSTPDGMTLREYFNGNYAWFLTDVSRQIRLLETLIPGFYVKEVSTYEAVYFKILKHLECSWGERMTPIPSPPSPEEEWYQHYAILVYPNGTGKDDLKKASEFIRSGRPAGIWGVLESIRSGYIGFAHHRLQYGSVDSVVERVSLLRITDSGAETLCTLDQSEIYK